MAKNLHLLANLLSLILRICSKYNNSKTKRTKGYTLRLYGMTPTTKTKHIHCTQKQLPLWIIRNNKEKTQKEEMKDYKYMNLVISLLTGKI